MSKIWLIADAACGVGRALAEAVLRAGGRVVAGAREPALLDGFAARHGRRVRVAALDIADEATVYGAVNTAVAAFGRLDVVVNNASRPVAAQVEEVGDANLRRQFEADFFGVVSLTHAVLPVLREQGSGRLVQVASYGDDATAARRAAQGALQEYLRALAKDAVADGVEIDLVEPAEMPGGVVAVATANAPRAPSARVVRFPVRPEAA